MKKHDIEAIFTAKVQDYILKGYTISTTTMNGHQGEIAKIDVTDGKEVIRTLLTDEREWRDDERREIEYVQLTIGRSTETHERRPHCNPFADSYPTLWNNKLDVIEQRTFYQINRNEDYFTEDFDEYKAMQDVQYDRMMKRDPRWSPKTTEMTSDKAIAAAVRYLKRKTGKSRITTKEIKITRKVWKDEQHYYIRYFSNEYRLA